MSHGMRLWDGADTSSEHDVLGFVTLLIEGNGFHWLISNLKGLH